MPNFHIKKINTNISITDNFSDYQNISEDNDTLESLPSSGQSAISDTISNFQNVYK